MATVDHEVPGELLSHLRIVLKRLNCRGTQTHDSSSIIELDRLGEPESEELRGVLKRLETEGWTMIELLLFPESCTGGDEGMMRSIKYVL